MPATPKAAVVMIARSEDGAITICDANGKSRVCSTIGEYADAINAILDDPSLPEFEDVPPQRAQVEEVVVAGVKEVMPPLLRPFVRPGLQTMTTWLATLSEVRRPTRGKRRRARRGKSRRPPTNSGRAA